MSVKKLLTDINCKKQPNCTSKESTGAYLKFDDSMTTYLPDSGKSKTMIRRDVDGAWIDNFCKPPYFELQCDLYKYYYISLLLNDAMILQNQCRHHFLMKADFLYFLYLKNMAQKFGYLATLIACRI